MSYKTQVEPELKNSVFDDFFNINKNTIAWTQERDRIDFTLYNKKTDQILLWAEAKKNLANPYTMLTQLVLTLKKPYDKNDSLPPSYVACFDSEIITFVPFRNLLPLFSLNDFNWTITPSNHKDSEFIKAENKVKEAIGDSLIPFNFIYNKDELKEFIKNTLIKGEDEIVKHEVTGGNFVRVYYRWLQQVKPSISLNWDSLKKQGLMDADFFLADLLSLENKTIVEKLFVLLEDNHYILDRKIDADGFETDKKAFFIDEQKAHKQFWQHYERPPKEEFQHYIQDRRDLLIPIDIRERKGSFFTPQIWVEKSQEYLAKTLGEDWQQHYYIWDCACGTGNLLVGLSNPRHIFASTLDKADVAIARRISGLFENQVFEFDFLNDPFDKLPPALKQIIDDPEKRKKLVIYINPPYAEATGYEGHKDGVTFSLIRDKYKEKIGHACNELFCLFLARCKEELKGCIIAEFSKLKTLQAVTHTTFRGWFKSKLLSMFLIPAHTFDNVKGEFPIGFKIWDTKQEEVFTTLEADVYRADGSYFDKKMVNSIQTGKTINDFRKLFYNNSSNIIAYLRLIGPDFQGNDSIYIMSKPKESDLRKSMITTVNLDNLVPFSVYYAVRKVIPSTWLNDRDQFLWPKDGWQSDTAFQSNCLAYLLFHNSNNIQSAEGFPNHFIPFTEEELGIKQEPFTSHFMTDFMSARRTAISETFQGMSHSFVPNKPIEFTEEAKAVLNAGKTLFQYYHSKAKDQKNYTVNASFYDIKSHFKGVSDKGRMNTKSTNKEFNTLMATLNGAMKLLAKQIEPKIYQYGFLQE